MKTEYLLRPKPRVVLRGHPPVNGYEVIEIMHNVEGIIRMRTLHWVRTVTQARQWVQTNKGAKL